MHFCILGCGQIARRHAQTLAKLAPQAPAKNLRFSFASRGAERAERYKTELGGATAFSSYEAALADSSVEVAVICTPNASHYDLAIQALNAGKHVVIEKPLACSLEEADAILALAKTRNLKVFVAENYAYRPSTLHLQKLVQSGQLGVTKLIRMDVLRSHDYQASDWRSEKGSMGGGPLIDGGIHWINAMLNIIDSPVTDLAAFAAPVTIKNCPQEDSITVTSQFANGAVGVLNYSAGIRGSLPVPMISAHGSKASAYVLRNGLGGLLVSGKLPKPFLLPLADRNGFEGMWKDFVRILEGGQPVSHSTTGEIGRRDLAYVTAAYGKLKPVGK